MKSLPRVCSGILLLSSGQRSMAQSTSSFPTPPSFSSDNGVLELSLNLVATTHTIGDVTLASRLFDGITPGPTLYLNPGDTLKVHFHNQLSDRGSSYVHNQFSAPDETNLHFHGLHVSGELPSDDAMHVIGPGESYDYETTLPEDHMAGTHWVHPHRHGSTSLQVGGGAVAAIIVRDVPGTLPSQVEQAKDVLFVAQEWDLRELQEIASESGDSVTRVSRRNLQRNDNNKFVTVNGQLNPIVSLDPGEWIRLRVIWAGWLRNDLNLRIPNCEVQLLAKDGIYIRDFPRSIDVAPIPQGGRADLMIRCLEGDTIYEVLGTEDGITMARIRTTSGPAVDSEELAPWTPVYPNYLSDLRTSNASPGCSCLTKFDDKDSVNGLPFDYDRTLHTSYLGAVVERNVKGYDHPYHQHVYPYQLISGFDNKNNRNAQGYHAMGDWHDTIVGAGTIRFQPMEFTGKMMVHCHQLTHEDIGMMAVEQVESGGVNATCTCSNSAGMLAGLSVVTMVIASVFVLVAI